MQPPLTQLLFINRSWKVWNQEKRKALRWGSMVAKEDSLRGWLLQVELRLLPLRSWILEVGFMDQWQQQYLRAGWKCRTSGPTQDCGIRIRSPGDILTRPPGDLCGFSSLKSPAPLILKASATLARPLEIILESSLHVALEFLLSSFSLCLTLV